MQSLDATDAEETQPPTTPPATKIPLLGTSPPHDSKVRQIRKRVKDLSWKEARRKRSDEGSTGEVDPQDDGPEAGDATSEGKAEEDDSSKSVSAKTDSDKEEAEHAGGEEHATTEATTAPPSGTPARSPSPTRSMELPKPTDATEAPVRTDVEEKATEKDIPRTSIPPVSPGPDACQGKRRRDDGDQNPREPKRISPPPEKPVADEKPPAVKPVSLSLYHHRAE